MHMEYAQFRCFCRLHPSGKDLMLFAWDMALKTKGKFILNSESTTVGQDYDLSYTCQLRWNGCAEVWN